ncbi:hypothetical protein F2Q69_00034885 [Brassica cretica]|uniref:Uncharacterized protein n=1 Tax=Brassica cretica TaxID=69181 RepID=A0A8S9SF37_BRACR|nr:hypothetical protein F2Q69_00034885 [Brassica cretica]
MQLVIKKLNDHYKHKIEDTGTQPMVAGPYSALTHGSSWLLHRLNDERYEDEAAKEQKDLIDFMSYGFIFLDSSVLAKTMDDKFLILCIFSPDETENTDMKEMERA